MAQRRAIDAIYLGLAVKSSGYNIFVCGPVGTGRKSTVRALLEERAERNGQLRDFAYVNNFGDADRPRLLTFKAGGARRFRRALETFVEGLPEVILHVLEETSVEHRRKRILAGYQALERELVAKLDQSCKTGRFQLIRVQAGDVHHLDIHALHKNKPIEVEELNELVAAGKARVPQLEELNERHGQLKEELRQVLATLRAAGRKMRLEVDELESTAVQATLSELTGELSKEFTVGAVDTWLSEVVSTITDRLEMFREGGDEGGEQLARRDELLRKLAVHIVLDNASREETPVVFENVPTFTNLLGTVERPSDEARGLPDLAQIRAGSLLRADGGFLILNANDAVAEVGVWNALIRVLKTGSLEIQSPEQFQNPGSATALKPEPIRVNMKVIALGDGDLYRGLYTASGDFRTAFKIKADFDDSMPRDSESLRLNLQLARRVEKEEGLVPINAGALACVAEHACRLAEHQQRLSARFGDLCDIQRQASYHARLDASPTIERSHILRAIAGRDERHNLAEERFHRAIRNGTIDISTSGKAIGTVNALTVIHMADHVFGQPCRVSATCGAGHSGVLSVEREVELSGQLHDKGTLIMSAYLRANYLSERPLTLTATVAFEQMHDLVDGDSASAAEAVSLLSTLARVEIRQNIAVTGAVDQRGRVQAVGGINEKIEGFFCVCQARGLTGDQGVAMPDDNRESLMLNDDVVAAVENGQFHIWMVGHLDELIELLTGLPAGQRQPDGSFPAGSFNAKVHARLSELARFARPWPDTQGGWRARGSSYSRSAYEDNLPSDGGEDPEFG